MYQVVTSALNNSSYAQYEVSSHAKEGFRCMHNLHYWNLDPYLAFGPSAHGYNGEKRWWNHRSLDRYIFDIDDGVLPITNSETLTSKNHYNELIMNGLRTSNGVNIDALTIINNQLDLEKSKKDYERLLTLNNHIDNLFKEKLNKKRNQFFKKQERISSTN